MLDQFIIIPSFSLEPNKLSTYNRVFSRVKLRKDANKGLQMRTGVNCDCVKSNFTAADLRVSPHIKYSASQLELNSLNKVTRAFHNFEISTNAHRTLKKKINWLYYLAKSKSIKTYQGKSIFNFKMAFITLTLPSAQKEPTIEVTKNLFNQFLTEVRQRTKMANYVWRLEFQKNGNVHYHIATDTYLDYFFALQVWNRILKKAGYIEPYTKKHSGLCLREYNAMYNASGKTDFSIMAKRYATGCARKWSNPNTVDVKSVISNKSISSYISKYFSKDADNKTKCNPLDNEENSKALRLWYCSRSLSKLNSVSDFCEAVDYDIYSIVLKAKKIKEISFRWAKIIYFEIKSFYHRERAFIERLLTNYARKTGYLPSI
jgi:hypothetical protein